MNAQTSEAAITAWLATQGEAMLELLRQMVEIDSGSYDKPGIDAVGAVAERFLRAHGIPVERLPQSRHGDCLRAPVPAEGPAGNAGGIGSAGNTGGNIVLMGHRDTVFPAGEAGRNCEH